MSEESPLQQDQALRIHDLMMRLDEAEETLRAIRCGEVDALVIKTGGQQHIYTLRGADHAYRVLFETLNEGALTLDSQATVLFANSQFARLVGSPLQQVLGSSCRRFVAPEDGELFQALLRDGIAGSSKGELRLLAADGAPVPVLVSISAVQSDELGSACTVVVADLSELKATQQALEAAHAELARAHGELEARVASRTRELGTTNAALRSEVAARKRLEDELRRRAEELVDADRRKDEFLSTLAHELRNPLAPILNSLATLHLLGPFNGDQQRHRDVIERQTRHLARLVDDLLDVSRITRGNITLRKEAADLRDLVERAVEAVSPRMGALNHELHISVPQSPIPVEVDPTRMEQILVNLLNNAAQYTEPGGRVWLTAEAAGGEAILRVRDNGIGIAPDLLPEVFRLFVQADRSLDRSQGGLGIGLTLVKTLTELHGGTVSAVSRGLGAGSEFIVRLPVLAHSNGHTRAPEAAELGRASRPLRVAVVDDNIDAAETLGEILELWGHHVCLAHHGEEAIEAATRHRAELVLLDIGLPGLDGYEVARRLRAEPVLEDAFLVALTGYGTAEDRRRAEAAGFDLHLTKPVSPEQVQRVLFQAARKVPAGPPERVPGAAEPA
jgi:PAS domain S-box-containing protein